LLFVMDASVTAAWALPDESSEFAYRLLAMAEVDGALVPPLWWYEIRNILAVSERKGRISPADSDAFLRHLTHMEIKVCELGDGKAVLRLARTHQLSVYDAAYLELALREHCPLGTLDGKLAKAALAESLPIFE